MGILNRELGSYDACDVVRLYGSFEVNGTTTPDLIRDGRKNSFTVSRVSAGLFEVTFSDDYVLPQRLIFEQATLSCAATLTAKAQGCYVVKDSYNYVTRKFRIVCYTVGDVALSAYTDPVVGDPNDNDRVNFELVGSISSAGTDLA